MLIKLAVLSVVLLCSTGATGRELPHGVANIVKKIDVPRIDVQRIHGSARPKLHQFKRKGIRRVVDATAIRTSSAVRTQNTKRQLAVGKVRAAAIKPRKTLVRTKNYPRLLPDVLRVVSTGCHRCPMILPNDQITN